MVATAIYSVTMVLWKETAFPLCRATESRWKRNVVSRVSSVIVVIRLPISMAVSCYCCYVLHFSTGVIRLTFYGGCFIRRIFLAMAGRTEPMLTDASCGWACVTNDAVACVRSVCATAALTYCLDAAHYIYQRVQPVYYRL